MKISVALAMYNGEKYIIKQLDSIVNQTMKVDEIVISDDGSTDGSLNIVNNYIFKNNSAKIKLLKNINHGHVLNFINALKNVEGDIIFLADQDDFWFNDKIESHMTVHDKYKCDLCASAFNITDENDNLIISKSVSNSVKVLDLKQVISNYMFNGMSLSIKRCENYNMMLEKMLYYNPWAHDSFINIFYALQYKVCYLDKICANHIIHGDNIAGARVGYKLRGSYTDRLNIAEKYDSLYENFDEMINDMSIIPKNNNEYFICSNKAHERYNIYKKKDSLKLLIHALKYISYYSSYKTFLADIYSSMKKFCI